MMYMDLKKGIWQSSSVCAGIIQSGTDREAILKQLAGMAEGSAFRFYPLQQRQPTAGKCSFLQSMR